MTFLHVIGNNDVEIWGLTPRERVVRQAAQLPSLSPIEDVSRLETGASVVIVDDGYVLETRTLQALLDRPNTILRCPENGRLAAAHVTATDAPTACTLLRGEEKVVPTRLSVVDPDELGAFDKSLRRAAPPILEPATHENRARLEQTLYGNAYKGITDLVTKFVWPRPARQVVRWCASAGITPNAVTITGFLLMLLAGAWFAEGRFAAGLVAAWTMTFLDTVDGKLARVTGRSSRFGHALDHGMDILHPPFWYGLWGMGLGGVGWAFDTDRATYFWLIVGGYVAGRLCEARFHSYAKCGIFGWRPFDSYFRLVTARRNPCLILLTVSLLVGRPDVGFIAVAVWTALTTAVLAGRLLYARSIYGKHGTLQSWLADAETAARRHPRAYGVFSVTRAAYPREHRGPPR